jgi:arabinofuranan 3-O-arabinosyltransferase
MNGRWRPSPGVVLLAVLAYLPALTSAPGRMPSDSKLYLYLDPQRLVSDSFHNFDPRQFAGWVPHQHIAYLWPSGPWFSAFEIIGVPDWIAHRLWIGTLLFAAGLGIRWVSRLLGLSPAGALAAAVVYQCSPYLLPYVSRTSVMLLPWAGLGWIVGLTMLATLRSTWRHAALLALVVLTVGSVNATALLMIVPAPFLWLVHAATSGATSWGRAAATAGRVGVLSIVVSLWWGVALVLQGRHGSDVLAFSETLEAVSFTSQSSEVLRGLGYWLFYVRDPFGATTTAAIDHLVSGRTVAVGVVLIVVCLVGLVTTAWEQRRYAVWLVLVGVVLAVGVHPIDDPSPLMAFVTGDGTSSLALALRSSTRAVPVSVFGLALGAGALVTALRAHQWRRRRDLEQLALAGVVALAVLNLPALWSGGLVDPVLERDQDPPAAWLDAVADLDARPDGYRVLQLPGAEFGSYRWGHTVDQPLPGLSDTPVVTRDLLPLGSPAAMDLLYALDDRLQRGVLDPGAIAPVARLFGAHTVWLTNDLAFDRFRTPRPDVVATMLAEGAEGLAPPRSFGEPTANTPVVPMVDEQAVLLGPVPQPLPPVQHLDVNDPVPVVRAKEHVVVLSGDGDGVVDAAAVGLIDGRELIRSAASMSDDELADAVAAAPLVVVTDTDRPRARHWRGSQDTVGFTEDGTAEAAVLRPADGDARLEAFDRGDTDHRTVAVQRGPVTARATAYGEPFAYRPEHRAWRAVDGDPTSAWLVADRFDAIGERLELELDPDVVADHLVVQQPHTAAGGRRITAVDVTVDGGAPQRIELDDRSLEMPGQELAVTGIDGATTIGITIAATDATPGHPDEYAAVGFAGIDLGLAPTDEVVVVSGATLEEVSTDTVMALVLTRERVRPTDRWRDDPEPFVHREVTLADAREFDIDVTVRLDQRAADGVLAELFGADVAVASSRLVGSAASAGWAAFDSDHTTEWISPFGSSVGATLTVEVDPTAPSGEVVVRQSAGEERSVITALRVADDEGGSVEVELGGPEAAIDLSPLSGSTWTFEITGVDARTTIDRRYGEPTVLPVSIASIEGDAISVVDLPTAIDTGCRSDLLEVDGVALPLRVSGAVEDLLAGLPVTAEPCDGAMVLLGEGPRSIMTAPGSSTGLQVDRIVLRSSPADEAADEAVTSPDVVVESAGRTQRVVTVDPCPDGCWIVLGEGYNPAWSARVGGADLGDPVLVDGGSNGWWLEPSDEARRVTFSWSPQPLLTAGLVVSGLGVALCIALVVADRRRRVLPDADRPAVLDRAGLLAPVADRRRIALVSAAWMVLGALVIDPLWALAPLPIAGIMLLTRSTRPAGYVSVLLAALGATVMVWRVVRLRPLPDAGWVLNFDDLHRPGLFLVTALFASAILADRRERTPTAPPE